VIVRTASEALPVRASKQLPTLLHVLHHFLKSHPEVCPAQHPWSRGLTFAVGKRTNRILLYQFIGAAETAVWKLAIMEAALCKLDGTTAVLGGWRNDATQCVIGDSAC
jgi:hypothetical protein